MGIAKAGIVWCCSFLPASVPANPVVIVCDENAHDRLARNSAATAYPVASNDRTIPSDLDVEIDVGVVGTGNVTEIVAPVPFD